MLIGKSKMADAFNEWMRRYTEDPRGFEAGFETAGRFLAEKNAGRVPSYGETCVAYLDDLIAAMERTPA